MSPEEIGLKYVRAAEILRATQEFGIGADQRLTRVAHTWNEQRTVIHEDSELFAYQVERIALQVAGYISDFKFETDFVVNLEAFSRINVDEGDMQGLRNIAMRYVPVRLAEYLRIPDDCNPEITFGNDPSSSRSTSHETFGIEETAMGLRMRRKVGFVTSQLIVGLSCFPAIIYLGVRASEVDAENLIQTTLAILASTLFIIASPVHRSLFNNWSITDAMTGRMMLDEDSVLNITSERERHSVGADLIALGKMSLLSSRASYASPYSARGLDPGAMELTTLVRPTSHLLVIDQDGSLVLIYGGSKAVELLLDDYEGNEPLKAREYRDHRFWHVVKVPASARRCLVY